MPLRDIKGQNKAIGVLRSALEQEKIPHAYMFVGPSGVGKHKTAAELASLLNCCRQEQDSCSVCPSCLKINKRVHPDVFFITVKQGKQNIPVEEIRQLSTRLSLRSFESRFKVAILDADYLSEEASNALLKILEEPAEDTIFVIIASDQGVVPDTIISRCHIIRFMPLSKQDIAAILVDEFRVDEKQAVFLSCLSGGDIKKALRFKQKDAIDWKNNIIDCFTEQDAAAYAGLDDMLSSDKDTQRQAYDVLAGFYRDILVYKYIKDSVFLINPDRSKDISRFAEQTDTERIFFSIERIAQAKKQIDSNLNLKLVASALKESLTE
jgi:DNA polymerase III subunit delta'